MPSEPESKPISVPASAEINSWYRAGSVLLGLAGLGSGGAAVFLTHVEAGPVALLVVGLLLLIIGMAGRLPSRIKIGENEAEWQAVERFVNRVVETSDTAKPEVLDALTSLAESAPKAASGAVRAVAYEQLVVSMLNEVVLTDATQTVMSFTAQRSDWQWDGVLTGHGRIVGVEIKAYSTPIPGRTIAELAGRLLTQSGPMAALLVTRSRLSRQAVAALEQIDDVYAVLVESARDGDRLAQAARVALKLDKSGRKYFAD